PRRARASHVLARVGETGGSEAEDKARATITDVIRRAKAGEDFAKLAKAISEDPGSASKGGDLGWARAHALRLPRDQGVRGARGRQEAAEGCRRADPRQAPGRGDRASDEGPRPGDPTEAAGREGP